MKHSFSVTLLLVAIFFFAQILGLVIVGQYIDIPASAQQGEPVIEQAAYEKVGVTPPPVEEKSYSFIYILGAVLLGTILILLIIKFQQVKLWKLWFFLSVILTLLMAFSPFIDQFFTLFNWQRYTFVTTIVLSLVLAYFKVYRPTILIHNITELFVYGGLATILVPILNVFSVVILLLLISLYDMYAVWKSKHMVAMADFQKQSMLFAGLFIPYGKHIFFKAKKQQISITGFKAGEQKVRTAILGGGDIAFPLLFSATIYATTNNFLVPLIIAVFTSVALFLLYFFADKNKYYPAMPFLAVGSFLGYSVTWLFGLV